ncbi:MAG: hypothetical protein BGO98_38855 [Myxococcales bacterium 68-20]|nr:MAG: hypothetical protein BGO98_38855 [Myxococcales bacterium 68-20]
MDRAAKRASIAGMTRSAMLALAAVLCFSCSKKDKEEAPAGSSTSAGATGATAPAAPAGSPPPDGKYERVIVDGVTVPMINVMDNGATILVDTDGVKPRTWEEQYKRKRSSLLVGQYDLHKTNANKNDTFEDDPIDKEGLWVIDSKGNITRH